MSANIIASSIAATIPEEIQSTDLCCRARDQLLGHFSDFALIHFSVNKGNAAASRLPFALPCEEKLKEA